uniref:Mitochondrial thiamine pyrophosphate carrier n=1 Tax=Globodera rostochiensis TaxID=31243 RepID=A0A914GR96_GLORO
MVVGLNRRESKKEDQESDLRPFQYVQAGFFTGVATRALIQPFDVIKIRLQLQEEPLHGKGHGKYSGVFQSAKVIYHEEGIAAFWRGHIPAQGLSFCTFELFTKQAVDLGLREFTKSVDFVCGAGAGCLATTCAMPFDVVRTRMVAQGAHRTYRNMAHAFIKTWRYEGPAGYFRGLVPSLLQIAPFTGLQFTFYNLVSVYWSSVYQGNNESIGRIVSGWVAGMAAKSITYPFDLVRHRLQVNRHIRKEAYGQTTSDRGMLRTFLGVIRRETVFGLFKGLSPAVLKAAVQSALSFFFYELVCDFLRS